MHGCTSEINHDTGCTKNTKQKIGRNLFSSDVRDLNLEQNHCSAIKVSHAYEKRICYYKYICTAINCISNLFHNTPIHAQMN